MVNNSRAMVKQIRYIAAPPYTGNQTFSTKKLKVFLFFILVVRTVFEQFSNSFPTRFSLPEFNITRYFQDNSELSGKYSDYNYTICFLDSPSLLILELSVVGGTPNNFAAPFAPEILPLHNSKTAKI